MDRTEPSRAEHSAAVPAAGAEPIELVPHAGGRVGGELGADANDRRAVLTDAVLRLAEHDVLADAARLRGQSQAGAALDADHGAGSDLSAAEHDPAKPGAQDLPVFTAGCGDSASQPGLEYGHHLHSVGPRLRLPDCSLGLVQPIRAVVGVVAHARWGILPGGAGASTRGGLAGDLQHGPGLAVHQPGLHGPIG